MNKQELKEECERLRNRVVELESMEEENMWFKGRENVYKLIIERFQTQLMGLDKPKVFLDELDAANKASEWLKSVADNYPDSRKRLSYLDEIASDDKVMMLIIDDYADVPVAMAILTRNDSNKTELRTLKMDHSTNSLQRRVGQWADKTFPHSDDKSKLEHIRDEIDELNAAPGDPFEAADIYLIMLHLAYSKNYDLEGKALQIKNIDYVGDTVLEAILYIQKQFKELQANPDNVELTLKMTSGLLKVAEIMGYDLFQVSKEKFALVQKHLKVQAAISSSKCNIFQNAQNIYEKYKW